MTQLLRTIAAMAFVFCLVKVAGAQVAEPSSDDTVEYINSTLHKYPTLEFVDSGCPGFEQVLSISSDRRSLMINQVLERSAEGRCRGVQTLVVPIFSLNREELGKWSKQGQHSSFFLDCINRVGCFTRRADAQVFPSVENDWYLQMTAPDQVSIRLSRAMRHLVDSLLAEADARIDAKDPFAKHAH